MSLKDRKCREDCVASCVVDVVRHGRLRWFGLLERKSEYDWVSSCRNMMVGARNVWAGAGRLGESARDDMKLLGLQP